MSKKHAALRRILLTAAMLATAPVVSAAAQDVQQALSGAEAAISEAKAEHWIWRDTEKLYEQAQQAAEKGENEKALELAKEAKSQAELALKQFQIEQDIDRGEQ
jgi:hypothetical protein